MLSRFFPCYSGAVLGRHKLFRDLSMAYCEWKLRDGVTKKKRTEKTHKYFLKGVV